MGASRDPRNAAAVRRELHQYPEPAWREFHTTSIIVDELEQIGVDEIHVGPDALDHEARLGVPDEPELRRWRERAEREGAREDVLEKTEGGVTGVVATLRSGPGVTVGIRADIDGLAQDEPTDETHDPTADGFRSKHSGMMHACGHDANTALALDAIRHVREGDFQGTVKVFFQPASEIEGGGKPMAHGPHTEDVGHMFVVNVGFDHPTGEVVAGVDGMYSIERFRASFEGESAHAAKAPDEGRNAVQAMATAVENLYAIPRNADGPTRVNVGTVHAGRATNLIADQATVEGEVRGETTALLRYMQERAEQVLDGTARMHDCAIETETIGEAPSSDSDDELAALVYDVIEEYDRVDSPVRHDEFGTGEDAAWLMNTVRENGGQATHVVIGTDHPTGHHTPTFDVDETSLEIGANVIAQAAVSIDRQAREEC